MDGDEEDLNMKLYELLNATTVEGWKKIQCWEDDNKPTIYCAGYHLFYEDIKEYQDREIEYIFPYTNGKNEACLCIELEKEEEI